MSLESLLQNPRNEVSQLSKAQFNKLPLQHQRMIIVLEQIAHMHNLGYKGTGRDRGINQLAERIGVNNATLQTYLRGTSDPLRMKSSMLEKIAKARKISTSTLRALLAGEDESNETEDEIVNKFFELAGRIPLQLIPEGIILLGNRLKGVDPDQYNLGKEHDVEVHPGNLRIWELIEEKWTELERALGYEPEEMPREELIEIADRVMRGSAKEVFEILENSSEPILNKYLTGGLSKFLGKSPSELIQIRDGKKTVALNED